MYTGNTKIVMYILLLVFIMQHYAKAQLHSVEFNGSWSSALSSGFSMSEGAREDIEVSSAAGFGGGLTVKYKLNDQFFIGLSGSYQYYSVKQDSALERWGWKFWETRYKGNVRDILNSDTTVKAQLTPRETLESYPVFITCYYQALETKPFTFSVYAGAGVIFYYRKLMLEETWSKYYPGPGYVFQYSFRNFAPTKPGNPLAVKLGGECTYAFSEQFALNGAISYMQIINTGSNFGADNFPFRRALHTSLGLTIFY